MRPAATPSRGSRAGFWSVAVLGIPAAAIAWTWYGFAQYEAQSEQGKALSAGTTMAGFGELFGGIPLVLAHGVGLAVLLTLGWFAHGRSGIVLSLVCVAAASVIGMGIAQLLWGGGLFELGIHGYDTAVP